MQYNYRQAKVEELDEIMKIFVDAQSFMQANSNPQWPKGFPDENDVKGSILGGLLYAVTLEDGEIAAVFSAMNYDCDYDGIDGNWLSQGNYLAVHRVAVAGKFRGRGAAKFIVNFAASEIARQRGRGSVRMDTHEKNAPMRALLKSQGFTECGIITLMRDDSLRIAFEKLI